MKYLLALLLVINPITFVAEINRLQNEAKSAFLKKNYQIALLYLEELLNEYQIEDENAVLNTAQTYFKLKNADKAAFYYLQLIEKSAGSNPSIALNQMGLIADLDQNLLLALDYFKQAIKKNPQNYEARYNYELMKKRLQKNKINTDLNTQNGNKDNPENKFDKGFGEKQKIKLKEESEKGKDRTEKEADTGEKEGNSKNAKPENQEKNLQPQRLEAIKLSKEKAETILNALKNQELQYIQQIQKKRKANSALNNQKPDW